MKSLMLSLAVVLATAAMSFAQSSYAPATPASIAVDAKIITSLSITSTQSLTFGEIAQGQGETIPTGGTGAGQFTITGDGAHAITLTASVPDTLGTGTGHTIPVSFTYEYVQNSPTFTGSSNTLNSSLNTQESLGGSQYSQGLGYVSVGGAISSTNTGSATPGNYTGQVTLSVVYH